MAFKTEAIVLNQRTLYGADRVYEVLSPDYGKLSIIGRSVARSSSKMAGHLEMFSHVKVMIGRGRQDHLAGARTIRGYGALREEWHDFILASSLVELVLTMNVSGQSAREEFELLRSTLDVLMDAGLSRKEKTIVARIFLWKMLSLSGWKPDLDRCAISRDQFSDGEMYYQSPKGFVAAQHSTNGILVDKTLKRFLELVCTEDDWKELLGEASKNGFNKEWLRISKLYYQDIISKPIQSLKLFHYV